MGIKTIKVNFTITVKSYENVPSSFVGGTLTLSWSKGIRSRDKGALEPVFCTEPSVPVNGKISFKTKITFDEGKNSFENKPFKLRLKCQSSNSTKQKIIGKETVDLTKYFSTNTNTFEDVIELSSKKYDSSKLSVVIVSNLSNTPSSAEENESVPDDSSNSELTEFNDVSSEEESVTDSLNGVEQPKRRKKIRRSATIGENKSVKQSPSQEGIFDDINSPSKLGEGKLNKKVDDFKKRLEKYKNTITDLQLKVQTLEDNKVSLVKEHESEVVKLKERIEEISSELRNKSMSSSMKPSTAYKLNGKPTREDKIIVMVVLIIFLILCVMDQFQKLIFGS